MIRQRVDIHGRTRQMEDISEIPCLQLKANEIGLMREAPARRWLDGQNKWDEKFKGTAKRVEKRREKIRHTYQKSLDRAKDLGLMLSAEDNASIKTADETAYNTDNEADGEIQISRRWGPLDLEGENPPPSAIAGRQDTVSIRPQIFMFHTHIRWASGNRLPS